MMDEEVGSPRDTEGLNTAELKASLIPSFPVVRGPARVVGPTPQHSITLYAI